MERSEEHKIKVIVVEDEKRIQEHICNKIWNLDNDFEIIGRADHGQEALRLIEELRPQVVFTDICMPVMDGLELIQRILQVNPKTIIVIISGYSDFTYAQQAIRYGVSNYLLKPLENDMLLETLFDIKKSLSYFNVKRQRHVIYSEGYQLIPEEKKRFLLAVVCVGNVIYSTQDDEVNRYYAEEMERISWNRIMGNQPEIREWFVADDHAVNQKIIAVRIGGHGAVPAAQFMDKLSASLRKETELCVNLCGSLDYEVEQEELWNEAKTLRHVIKKRLVIGESRVFYQNEAEPGGSDMMEIVKMKMNVYIKNYLNTADMEHFLNEIRLIFQYMQDNHATQESVEKICVYVLKLLEFSKQGFSWEFLEGLQNQMMKQISMTVSENELFENLIRIFGTVNHEREGGEEEENLDKILSYIDERYLIIESLEAVAEEFGYNYTYFSRMFKEKVGEPLSHYITRRKIELAKDLLLRKPELKVTEISDLCGYSDYRYFGRVFKNEAGMSPTEYRENASF